jgi:large subunit ribosomal protein L6
MSRVGKQPITVPAGVKVNIAGNTVDGEGPKGRLSLSIPAHTSVKLEGGSIVVSRVGDSSQAKAMHGLARALLNNMVLGLSTGFSKRLEIQGVGFKAAVSGETVTLSLGFSHPINYPIPAGIKVKVEEGTKVTIEGPNRQLVGMVAAELRSFYPPEPYKGKGVRYSDEKVKRKEGKTVQ